MTVMKASDLLKAADTHANRPAANAVPTGALYSCTTHNLIYRSDGSAWSTWATLSSGGSTVFAGAKVYRSAAYSLLDSALTDVPWDAEEYDTDAFHDNTTNNNRLTIPTGLAGKYALKANVGTSVGGFTYSRFILLLAKNGSVIRGARVESDFGTSCFPMMTVSMDVDLAVGDYVTCSYLQISGGTRALDTADCAMSLAKIG